MLKQYMVEFDVPSPLPEEFQSLIEDQQEQIDYLFTKGKLMSYSLSENKSRLWVVFIASSESELIRLIDLLPLSNYMDFNYTELVFHQSLRLLPAMSLN